MAGKFLIDVTDDRFKIPPNDDVISFIRRVNPFSHSDVGSLLIDIGKAIDGSAPYCPSYGSCAYVVLHTADDRVFAISYGQHTMAFRRPLKVLDQAVADGGALEPNIGAGWVRFEPWGRNGVGQERLAHWARLAFADVSAPPAA